MAVALAIIFILSWSNTSDAFLKIGRKRASSSSSSLSQVVRTQLYEELRAIQTSVTRVKRILTDVYALQDIRDLIGVSQEHSATKKVAKSLDKHKQRTASLNV